jgi:flagellar biosynthesis/type III secretory pathway chaperone
MSMTQCVLDELRQIADKIEAEANLCHPYERTKKLESFAQDIRKCADDIGDD